MSWPVKEEISILFSNLLARDVIKVIPIDPACLMSRTVIDITYWDYFSSIGKTVCLIILTGILVLWFDSVRFFLKFDRDINRLLLLIFFNWVGTFKYIFLQHGYQEVSIYSLYNP